MTSPLQVAVIGSGVAGLSIAWKLAQQGHHVTVFEKDLIGSGASSRAGGMLAPTAEVRFEEERLLELGQKALSLWGAFRDELQAISQIDIGYRSYGTMIIAVDRDDLDYIRHMHAYQKDLGLDCDLLDGHDARRLEPGLAGSVPGALHIPNDHNLDPTLLVKALAIAVQKSGGHLLEHTPITSINLSADDGRVTGVTITPPPTTEDPNPLPRIHNADVIVAANGPWLNTIANLPPDAPRVRPVKGQMLALGNYTLSAPIAHRTPLFQRVLRGPDAYLIPRNDGRIIIGATMEEMGWNADMTAGGVFELLRGAWEFFPSIIDAPLLDTWTAFRPMTIENEPLVEWSQTEGLLWATGFGRNGILLTPWAAAEGAAKLLSQ